MANSVIDKEQVVTTVQKAKEVRRVVDRLITIAKKATPAARRLAFDRTRDDAVVKKLFTTLAERYKTRNGGYTRVLRLSDRRWGDAAEMAVLELVDHAVIDRKKKPTSKTDGKKDAPKDGEELKAADPINKFRKMFSPRSKVSAGHAKAAHTKAAGGAGRKTPAAGGGGSKSGGSSA